MLPCAVWGFPGATVQSSGGKLSGFGPMVRPTGWSYHALLGSAGWTTTRQATPSQTSSPYALR